MNDEDAGIVLGLEEIRAKAARIGELQILVRKRDQGGKWAMEREIVHLQAELQLRFGAQRGMRPMAGGKLPAQLGRRSGHRNQSDWYKPDPSSRVWDHPTFYKGLDGKPAMAAVHVYNAPKQDEEGWTDWLIKLAEFCQVNGLRFEVVKEEEFPSWYMPGVTQLVAYFPL